MLNVHLVNDLINPGYTLIRPGLERMYQILLLLDNPQNNYQTIHIAGTNGKGSTATFIETGMVHAGYKIGKFTSPYIHVINECICLNQQFITDDELEQTYSKLKSVITQNNLILSPFEFLTAIMFEYFSMKKIDWLILEAGMGGLDDATNVVDSKFSIITNVSLEHSNWLGNTVGKIAKHKAGIIKSGKTIIADNKIEIIQAVEERTMEYINVLDKYKPQISLDVNNFKTNINFLNKSYCLNLFGKFQAYNFLCAYEVLTSLRIPDASITHSANNIVWPGRLQIMGRNPLILFDATHNVAGVKCLHESLSGIYTRSEIIIITSILRDKDIHSMLEIMSKIADSVIYTTLNNNPRSLLASDLAKLSNGFFENNWCIDNPKDALNYAHGLNKKAILVTGSLYLLNFFNT